ncbi:MAG: hypothetical protein SX243_24840 [Acidobacteriota bacterium]|nr:hypothetical protein [Acidobacteriota bacterium]
MSKTVLLVADRVENHQEANLQSKDLERLEDAYFEKIRAGILECDCRFRHIDNPAELIRQAPRLPADTVVFPLWSGVASRSRRALVPSICEAWGVPYVGSDAYTQVICQDKFVAKRLATRAGLSTPQAVLLTPTDFQERRKVQAALETLALPLVVKPNFEGGSIGISQRSLVHSYVDAESTAHEVHSIHRQPILVEEFAEGVEASLLLVFAKEEIFLEGVVLYELHEGPCSLEKTIYSLELKKVSRENISQKFSMSSKYPELFERVYRLVDSLGKVHIIRVDGRMRRGDFQMIELSPDIYLGPDSCFEIAAEGCGESYARLISFLVSTASW